MNIDPGFRIRTMWADMPSALDIPKTGHLQSNGLHRLTCTFQTDDDRREVWAELEEQACRAWEDSPAREMRGRACSSLR